MLNKISSLVIAFIAAIGAAALMSGCSLMYYSDTDAPGGDPTVSSGDSENASNVLPTAPEALFRDTVTVSNEQLAEIREGMTCAEVVGIFGETQSFGRAGYRQYVTEDGRVIQFRFDGNNDGCPYSGYDLDYKAVSLKYSEELPEGTLYGVLIDFGGFVTFGTGETDGAELLTNDAEIVFEDGSAADKHDLKPGTPLLISCDKIIPGTVEQWHCTKIVILPVKSVYASEYKDVFDIIPANTSYDELLGMFEDLETFGELKRFESIGYALYITEDHHMIPLRFDSPDDLCPYSGAELYERSLPLHYDGEVPEGMTYGVLSVVGDEMLFTYYFMISNDIGYEIYSYGFNTVRLVSKDAEIVFKDGAPASANDLDTETIVLVQHDEVIENDLEEMYCTKIVIL